MQFARAALAERNRLQRAGYAQAELYRVYVFRGLPHVDHAPEQNRRCLMQASQWRKDGAVVELRDLKYQYQYGADGEPIRDVHGRKTPKGPGREKGVDVLCALTCLRDAFQPDVDIVMLASRDTDLQPVLDTIFDLRGEDESVARIETLSWHGDVSEGQNFGSLRATAPRQIWNTNLGRSVYEAALDRNDYT